MNFKVSSLSLLNSLTTAGSVILSKNTMQILDNFLLTVENNILTITASDLESTIVTSLEVEQDGETISIALPAKLLMNSLRQFSDEELTFNIDNETLAVTFKSQSGDYHFIGVKGDDFPDMGTLAGDVIDFDIDADILAAGVAKVGFATATDDLRPTMTGIYFDIKPERITFVATDAHKLAKLENTSIKTGLDTAFILPRKPVQLLKSNLDPKSENVKIEFDSKNIIFTAENFTMYTRQIEGRYPNYNGVIPQNNPYRVIIDRMTLVNALKRVASFSNQGTNLVKFAIEPNKVVLTTQDIDFSTSAKEEFPCQFEGEALNIGFKSNLLLEILNSTVSDSIVMELSSPTRAGLVLPFENEPDEELTMLLMPMLVGE